MDRKIAYLGPEGSFTHMAAVKYFGEEGNLFFCFSRIVEAAERIEKGETDFCVVPAENSTGGLIADTLDLFVHRNLKVFDEIRIPIIQNLLSNTKREEILRIYSHPQSFLQCREYLSRCFPKAELIMANSNSQAALTASGDPFSAAIGPLCGAQLHGLQILEEAINDSKTNVTRFFILSKESSVECKGKSMILFSVPNQAGALYKILKTFRRYRCNMTQIASRPSKEKNWEYIFIIEFENLRKRKKTEEMLRKIERCCVYCNYIGTY